jgi:hypothetical protein
MFGDDDDGGLRWWAEVGRYEQGQQLLIDRELHDEIRESHEKESQVTAGTDRAKWSGEDV